MSSRLCLIQEKLGINIRVLMLNLPHMLTAILCESVGKEPDVELIDFVDDDIGPAQLNDLDVVLVPCDDQDVTSVWSILKNQPEPSVLALNRDAKLAYLFEIQHEPLGEPSAENLLAVLRRVGQRRELKRLGDNL